MKTDSQYIYSFEPIVPYKAKILILGSMPSVLSLEKQQFYGNAQNRFWNVLFFLLEQRPADTSYDDKLKFLHKNKIALWDVIKSCVRPGSLDSNISAEQPNDINGLVEVNQTITHVFFNGTKAKAVYEKHFDYKNNLTYTLLPSTSPIPRKNIRNIDDLITAWAILKDALQ